MNTTTELARCDVREPRCDGLIVEALRQHGIVVLSGVSDRADLLRVGRDLMTIRIHRDSDLDGVTSIRRRSSDATSGLAGFTDQELTPHTEGSAVAEPPQILLLVCSRRPQRGGQSLLVDGQGLYQRIAENDPAMLDALRSPRSAHFGTGSGHLGSVFEANDEHRIIVRLRC